ncbi:MAG: TIM-barrel domain-containing protein, partial [Casimicrobium sp.]
MQIDFTDFDRIRSIAPNPSATNEAIATTADGNCVAISLASYGTGIMRLRVNPIAKPDYGLIVAKTDDAGVLSHGANSISITSGKVVCKLWSDETHSLQLQLTSRGKPLLQSTSDEHFRGMAKPLDAQRVSAFGLNSNRSVFALELNETDAVYGLGEKGSALNKVGQLVTSRVEDALGVNTDLAYKNTPFAWAITRNGCWGVLTHTTVDVHHGVGYPQWSNRSYVVVSEEPQLDLFLIATDTPAEMIAAYHRLTGKPENVPLWSLGAWISRAYYKNEDDIMATAKEIRDLKFPADVITFDGRAWQDTPTRFHFNFDPSRYPDPKRVIDNLKALDYKICCWEYPIVSINHPHYAEYRDAGYFLKKKDGSELVFQWDTGKKTTPFGPTLTPLP